MRQLNFLDELIIDNFAGGGVVGSKIDKPLPTVTAIDHNSLTMPYLTQ